MAKPNSARSVEPLTLSVEETARLLGIGRQAAYQAARTGQIPTLRIGRFVRVPRTALERLLAEGSPVTRPVNGGRHDNE